MFSFILSFGFAWVSLHFVFSIYWRSSLVSWAWWRAWACSKPHWVVSCDLLWHFSIQLQYVYSFMKLATAVWLPAYLGRILSRLSKDQDTIDTELTMSMMQVHILCSVYLHCKILSPPSVSIDIQFCPGYDSVGILHLPTVRNHLCSYGGSLLCCINVLSTFIRWDQASRFIDAVGVVRQLFRYVFMPRKRIIFVWCCQYLCRDLDWPFYNPCVSRTGWYFFFLAHYDNC